MSQNAAPTEVIAREQVHWGVFFWPILMMLSYAALIAAAWWVWSGFTALIPASARPAHLRSLVFWSWLVPALPALPWLLLLLVMVSEKRTLAHTVTTTHLQFKSGWFCLGRGEVQLADLQAAFVIESFVGSVLGYGEVKVTVKEGAILGLRFVRNSRQFCQQVQHGITSRRNGRQPSTLQFTGHPQRPASVAVGHSLGEALNDLTIHCSRPMQDDSRYMPKW